MIARPRGGSSGTSGIARALRLATICVLVVLTSGVLPVAGRWLEDIRGCDRDVCVRCDCRHRTAPTSVRAPCPCCESHPAAPPGHLTPLDPALLPCPTCWPLALETSGLASGPAGRSPLFTPDVPHPPPRPAGKGDSPGRPRLQVDRA